MQLYRHRIDAQVKPALGQLRIRELTVGAVDRHLRAVAATSGPAMSKLTRSVLSGMCGLAARHDALERNPVRDAGRISRQPRKPPKALTAAEARQLRAMLTYHDVAIARDLPDLVSFMLASGLRIGEASAVTWDAVDLDTGLVEVRGTVIRVKGQGLIVKTTKTAAGRRTLALPRWGVDLLSDRRRRFDPASPLSPVFPGAEGGPPRPVEHPRAPARQPRLGRHAVGHQPRLPQDHRHPAGPGRPVRPGHRRPARPRTAPLTQNVYMGRHVASTAAATALEALD